MSKEQDNKDTAAQDKRALLQKLLQQKKAAATFPQSFGQQRLWFIDQLSPGKTGYNTVRIIRLKGVLDVAVLERAFNEIVCRHDVCRTRFIKKDGEPAQQIQPSLELQLDTIDLVTLSPEKQEHEVERIALEKTLEVLDLEQGPLIKISLLKLAEKEHVLILVIHHIITDGWSSGVINRELSALYNAYIKGEPSPLEKLNFQYTDFTTWQRKLVQGELGQQQLNYWRNKLAGAPPMLELSTDHRRPAVQSYMGGVVQQTLSSDLLSKLNSFAKRQNSSLFMMLMTAFYILLWRYTGQKDIVVGSPFAGRNRTEFENMIGLFINVLPMRTELNGEASFITTLKQVREVSLETLDNQDVPFDALVSELSPERTHDHHPVFQVMFTVQQPPLRDLNLNGLSSSSLSLETRPLAYDLTLVAIEEDGETAIHMSYNKDLFEKSTIVRMVDNYQQLLHAIVADPDRRICDLHLHTDAEYHQIIQDWNQTQTEYPRALSIHQLFELQAEKTPNAIAAEYAETQISYAQLNQHANRLAHYLTRCQVGPGVLVGLCLERSVDMVVAMLAILKSGAAYVPLDPDYPQERLAFMLEDSAAPVVITHSSLLQRLPRCSVKIICLDSDAELLAQSSATNLQQPSAAEDLAYVIYTSGSTGTPKGVAVPHRGVVRLVCNTNYIQWQATDRVVQASVCSFDAATFEIWGPLLNGACLVGVSRDISLSPKDFATFLRVENISVMFLTTALFNQMAREASDVFATLRYVLFGGQAVSPAWVRAVLDNGPPQHLLHVYGPTETTTFATSYEVTALAAEAVTVPIGRPIANTTAYVLDEYRKPVPVGVAGELYLGGDGVAREYLHRPELTTAAFVSNPFSHDSADRLYRTGDWVRYLGDGNIEFIGRRDLQVKIRGFRIELGEIEAALVKLSAVRDSALLVKEDDSGDQRLVAYIVPVNAQSQLTREQLQQQLREHLPEYMIPSVFVQLDALPLNANGKVDKKALPEPAMITTSLVSAVAAPRNTLEKIIATIFRDVLQRDDIGINDNFFDLGGHSLLLVKVHSRLAEECGSDLSIIDLFEYSTIAALAKRLGAKPGEQGDAFAQIQQRADRQRSRAGGYQPIAIIGMSGRFPAAENPDELWKKLCEGFEPVEEYSVDELLAEGISQELLDDPDYIRAGIVLDDVGMWDAPFFGFTPREAQVLDPQQRLFLECAWEALENSGCDPERYPGAIGVFAGIGVNRYQKMIDNDPVLSENFTDLENLISSDKDFVATRASYKFNLTGPSLTVQTACSTSLVAIHMAVRSLQAYESDMALAGGVSIKLPQKTGYIYYPQGIASPDCHCRAFDADAKGTMRGNGACIIALKRLDDAIADGDTIHAVIRGSAINNDGAGKIGYTAPGIEGQAQVIAAAQAEADIDPASIGYVETHGTGTPLGDPVEVAALTQAFRAGTDAVGYCGIGSIKTNIGHLDAAAGSTGFLKAALVVEHGRIPASLHFTKPNPEIDFVNSPFYVVDKLMDWPATDAPRRAAVSSFGVGGTNAHVIIEQAPPRAASGASRKLQLLPISAKTAKALDSSIQRLAEHLSNHPEQSLADIAWTLQSGRREFEHRVCIVCTDREDAIKQLGALSGQHHAQVKPREGGLVFMFSGQGSQYPNMGLGLYQNEKIYRECVDQGFAILQKKLGIDLKSILYPDDKQKENSNEFLRDTAFAQPALFVTEYATARLWMSWGMQPEAMVGHSIGEYVAACIAGVLSFEDALLLVVERGRMISELPAGTMLAVPLTEAELKALLPAEISLAAVNAPQLCVVSGEANAMADFAAVLKQQDIEPIELHTSHAFHSAMMDPVLDAFAARVAQVTLKAPEIPYMSNLSGCWITAAEATDPQYWAQHLRQGVRFSDAITTLSEDDSRIFLEVGPGKTLMSLVQQHLPPAQAPRIFGSIHHPREQADDHVYLLEMLAGLWLAGAEIRWADFSAGEQRQRVALPTYPFERKMYWVGAQSRSSHKDKQQKKASLADWFYTAEWTRSVLPANKQEQVAAQHILVLCDQCGLGETLIKQLIAQGDSVVKVVAGAVFKQHSADHYTIDPAAAKDYQALLAALQAAGNVPQNIVHMFALDEFAQASDAEQQGFYSLLFLAQAFGAENESMAINVISEGVHAINGSENLCPEKALLLGMCRVIPDEYPNLACRQIDLVVDSNKLELLAAQLCGEFKHEVVEPVLAYRNAQRLKQVFQPLSLSAPTVEPERLRQSGVYLITGGLGGIGLALAGYLAESVQAKLVLITRSEFPQADTWPHWLQNHDESDAVSIKIRKLQTMQAQGAELMIVSADVADESVMSQLIAQVKKRFGAINGVIHSAGVGGGGVIALKTKTDAAAALAPKVAGTRNLQKLLDPATLDFIVLCSSLSSILGGASRADYCAANAYQDAYAAWSQSQTEVPVFAINWDSWREVGMAVDVELPPELAARRDRALRTGISVREGVEVFRRILSTTPYIPQVLVSTVDFASRLPVHAAIDERADDFTDADNRIENNNDNVQQRSTQLTSHYAAASSDSEQSLAALWHELLGIEQIGINDNFFELGGHSLLALRVIGRTNKLFEVELALQDLFDRPTVGELAAHIDSLCGAQQADHSMVAELLDSVEQLSDDDLAALLAQAEADDESGLTMRRNDDE